MFTTTFTEKDRIIKSKVDLNASRPFFAYILMNMLIEKTDSSDKVPTMAVTEYGDLYWNEEFTKKLTDAQLQGVLAHESMHVATLTFQRKGDRDMLLWNIATDLVINTMLIADGMELPKDCILPDKKDCWEFKGKGGKKYVIKEVSKKNAEDIYDFISSHAEEIYGELGNGEGEGGQKGGFDSHIEAEGKDENGDDKGSSATKKANQEKWKKVITEAATNAKQRGQGGGLYDRILGELLEPELDWRAILANFITKDLPVDFTMRRPGRRFYSSGVYYPSIIRENLEVCVWIDVSGSISGQEYDKFMSEIMGIASAFDQIRMKVGWWSTEVTDLLEVTKMNIDELPEYKFRSTGGTTMSCVAEKCKKDNIQSQIHVILTDGCIESSPKVPDGQKLFVTAGEYAYDDIIKQYGQVCKLRLT